MDGRQLQMVAEATPLVERVVREFASVTPRHHDRIEMAVCGRLQLLEAVREYDPDGGESFAEFALPRIRGAIAGTLLHDGAVPMDPFDPRLGPGSQGPGSQGPGSQGAGPSLSEPPP